MLLIQLNCTDVRRYVSKTICNLVHVPATMKMPNVVALQDYITLPGGVALPLESMVSDVFKSQTPRATPGSYATEWRSLLNTSIPS